LESENAASKEALARAHATPPPVETVSVAAAAPKVDVVPLRREPVSSDGRPPPHYLKSGQVRDPGVAFAESASYWRRDWSPPRNW
jgi:hypothetical protein